RGGALHAADDLLPRAARPLGADGAGLLRDAAAVHDRADARDLGRERLLSRRQPGRPDRAAVVAVPHAGCLSARRRVGPLPPAVRPQPAERDCRRVPRVAGVRAGAGVAARGDLGRHHRGAVRDRVRVVQEDGQVLRGRHLMTTAIQLDRVSKRYRAGRSRTLGDLVASKIDRLRGTRGEVYSAARGRVDSTIHAMRDVSLEVREGTGLGVIGRNGAGKTTLLKLISRVTWPTSGTVRVAGHVVS